jgi:tRNA1Val (adenine37-N6)-methyltransferase
MANNYFKFKCFTIYQNNNVLKVSTDACLLGATTPQLIGINNVLDIGCGTGLLTFMLAQKFPLAKFTTLDINEEAISCIKENYLLNKSNFDIKIECQNILLFMSEVKYELIICNPPFFINQLVSTNKSKEIAKHNTLQFYNQLLQKVKSLLNKNGLACILIDINLLLETIKMLKTLDLRIVNQINIAHSKNHKTKRIILQFENTELNNIAVEETINIYEADNKTYSMLFQKYMANYYLSL